MKVNTITNYRAVITYEQLCQAMIEFKVEEGQDPKQILLEALPPLQNLTIESIEQITEPSIMMEPLTDSIN